MDKLSIMSFWTNYIDDIKVDFNLTWKKKLR